MSGLSDQTSIHGSSPHIEERGSLRTLADNQSQFIGSSTGIYFVNMVRRAFADADVHQSPVIGDEAHPSPEDCIVADEDDGRPGRLRSGHASTASTRAPCIRPGVLSYGPGIPTDLGQPPPQDVARKLFMTYFQTWHRFFPFLHGPTVGKDLESLYTAAKDGQSSGTKDCLTLPRAVILQCLFNLASHHSTTELPVASRIHRPAQIVSCLLGFAAKGDIISIQALFAAQLLLVSRMSLRTAVVISGLLSRSIFLAGLHRCPVRYTDLSEEDCEIRKRLFWCIYVIDRYLSQALGHPLGIQDSDVDVCSLSGPELHPPHFVPRDRPETGTESSATQGASSNKNRNEILAFQVEYSRLSGRALEIFHKSIHIRSIDPRTVLSLRTDLDVWWNSLPSELQDFEVPKRSGLDQEFSAPGYFILLHRQLRLLMNRPWLSLEPSTAEFQSALQICISASRDIILNMRRQHDAGCGLFWPGYLSVAWMSGIILAFASHLQLYPVDKGQREVALCLDVLSGMANRWPLAKNCHIVLSELQQTVEQRRALLDQRTSSDPNPQRFGQRFQNGPRAPDPGQMRAHKRVRINQNDNAGGSPGRFIRNTPPQTTNRPAEQASSIASAEASCCDSVKSMTTNRRPSASFQGIQPGSSSSTDQSRSQQHPSFLKLADDGLGVTNDSMNVHEPHFPSLSLGSDDFQLSDLSGMSYWDGGMPDVLHGAAWESLFQGQTQSWDV